MGEPVLPYGVYVRSAQNNVTDRFRNGEEATPSRGWR
jgi:hypothetical protein